MGIAERLIEVSWKLIPQRKREYLSQRILLFREREQMEIPYSEVRVFSFTTKTKERFPKAESIDAKALDKEKLPAYSLLLTCLNEASNIGELLDSIAAQSHPPQELIICDGGSKDKTVETIRAWQGLVAKGCVVRVIEKPGANIAEGRNLAAAQATAAILLFTDAGSALDPDWALRLIAPFMLDVEVEFSMGWYQAHARQAFERALIHFLVPRYSAIDPRTFLPSGRSVGIRREIFFLVGGYPEHLSLAGEDSLFDFYVKTRAKKVAFVPDALAHWKVPTSKQKLWKTISNYAKGDAESGFLFWKYYGTLLPALLKIGIEFLCFWLAFVAWVAFGGLWWGAVSLTLLLMTGYRGLKFLLGYGPYTELKGETNEKFYRLSSLALMVVAQGQGFSSGYLSKKEAEIRRIAASKGAYMVFFLPQFFSRKSDELSIQEIDSFLLAGHYVLVVYARGERLPSREEPSIAHPRLESHLRSAFLPEAWIEQHRQFLDERGVSIRDYVQDSWSSEISEKLKLFVQH